MKRSGLIMLLAVALFAPLAAQSLDVELQRAVQRETATGDLKRALAEYRAILDRATRPPRDRGVAAKALLRIAEAHQRLGEAEARRWYEQIVSDYPDLPQAVTARAALKGTTPHTPAGLTAHRAVWTVADGGDIYGKVSPDGKYLPYTNLERARRFVPSRFGVRHGAAADGRSQQSYAGLRRVGRICGLFAGLPSTGPRVGQG
jgi:hypothetical protein